MKENISSKMASFSDDTSRFVILGCGHTGSTLVSGIFKISGFKTIGFPTSTFESRYINEVCNWLYERRIGINEKYTVKHMIAALEKETNGQWCIKDPLLSFLMDTIYPYINNPIKIIFNIRNPNNTVTHLIEERKKWRPDLSFVQAKKSAEMEWLRKNKAVIDFLGANEIPFLIIDYDDLLEKKLTDLLDRFVGKPMNYEFINPKKRRAGPSIVSDEITKFYQKLQFEMKRNHKFIKENMSPIKRNFSKYYKVEFYFYILRRKLIKWLPVRIYNKYYGNQPIIMEKPFINHEEFLKKSF